MSLVPSLFGLMLVQLAIGVLLCLPLLEVVGKAFCRFVSVSILLLLIAMLSTQLAQPADVTAAGQHALWAGAATAVLLIVLQGALGAVGPWPARIAIGLSCLAGAAFALLYFRMTLPAGGEAWQQALRIAGLTTTMGTLGAVMAAMVLGHWYLVNLGLSIAPFRLMGRVLIVALVLRLIVSALAFWLMPPLFDEFDTLTSALVRQPELMMRVAFGLVLPIVFAVMTDQTIKIQNTQAATGLLYATIIPVMIGEAMANFLYLTTPTYSPL